MDEASAFKFGDAVRKLFLSLIVLNHPSDPLKFYTDHRLMHWPDLLLLCIIMIMMMTMIMTMMMMMMITIVSTGISCLKTGPDPAARLQLRTGFKSLLEVERELYAKCILQVPQLAARGAPASLQGLVLLQPAPP